MSGISIVLVVGAMVAAAVGIALVREFSDSFVLPTVVIGLALCACIEAGRQWSA